MLIVNLYHIFDNILQLQRITAVSFFISLIQFDLVFLRMNSDIFEINVLWKDDTLFVYFVFLHYKLFHTIHISVNGCQGLFPLDTKSS